MDPVPLRQEPAKSPSRMQPAVVRIHLWLESGDGVLFGMGRLLLLREIDACGSLTAAAANLGMSYRGAWGKIKKTEDLLGEKLLERRGCRRSGYRLTPFGKNLSDRFDEWFQAVERFALEKSNDLLPLATKPFSEKDASDLQPVKSNMLK